MMFSNYNIIHHSDDSYNIISHSDDSHTAVPTVRLQLRAERIGVLWTFFRFDVSVLAALEVDFWLALKELVIL